MFRPLSCLWLIVAALLLPPRLASAQQPTGSIRGTVRALPTMVGLPYAVVSLPAHRLERFSGADGTYLLGNVPAGEHELVVRRIGFVPRTVRVRITAGEITNLDLTLDQIPVRLAGMVVNPVQPCRTPGLPDSASQPQVWQLVATLRENAAAYRLLVTQYPFAYVQARAMGEMRDTIVQLRVIDSIALPGSAAMQYRPGRVVSTVSTKGRRETVMQIPTIIELADPAFVANHCYSYGGSGTYGSETWYRLDLRAADRLRSPDVHGAAYLDSATSQLRRLDLELSRPDRLPRAFANVRAVRAITTFMEIAPGLGIIDGVCAMNWMRDPLTRSRSQPRLHLVHPIELQHAVAYEFVTPPPDVAAFGKRATPDWRLGRTYEARDFGCAEGG